jgi:hypothetical protein
MAIFSKTATESGGMPDMPEATCTAQQRSAAPSYRVGAQIGSIAAILQGLQRDTQ